MWRRPFHILIIRVVGFCLYYLEYQIWEWLACRWSKKMMSLSSPWCWYYESLVNGEYYCGKQMLYQEERMTNTDRDFRVLSCGDVTTRRWNDSESNWNAEILGGKMLFLVVLGLLQNAPRVLSTKTLVVVVVVVLLLIVACVAAGETHESAYACRQRKKSNPPMRVGVLVVLTVCEYVVYQWLSTTKLASFCLSKDSIRVSLSFSRSSSNVEWQSVDASCRGMELIWAWSKKGLRCVGDLGMDCLFLNFKKQTAF